MRVLVVHRNYQQFLTEFYEQNSKLRQASYRKIHKAWLGSLFGNVGSYKRNSPKKVKVEEIVANDIVMQQRWLLENGYLLKSFYLLILSFLPWIVRDFLNLNGWESKVAILHVKKSAPDVVYINSMTLFNEEDLRWIKNNCQLVVGQIAATLPRDIDYFREYDLIISSFPHFIKKFRKMGIESEYLPWCFDDYVLKKINKRKTKKKYEISFVGSFTEGHDGMKKILRKLNKKFKVSIWSFNMKGEINDDILKMYQGSAWGKKMYEIYRDSKIVINRHIKAAHRVANNMRMFEVTGVGTLLVTEEAVNLNEFFRKTKEVVTYKNMTDLGNKIEFYLNNEEKREKIALAGQKRCLLEHTYKTRMRELVGILRKYI